MKKYLIRICFLLAIGLCINITSHAQVVVKVRPVAPVIVRPIAPGPRHVWIDGEWAWRAGRYEYVNGYWAEPRFAGARWIPGHWKYKRVGWVWVPGHWRR